MKLLMPVDVFNNDNIVNHIDFKTDMIDDDTISLDIISIKDVDINVKPIKINIINMKPTLTYDEFHKLLKSKKKVNELLYSKEFDKDKLYQIFILFLTRNIDNHNMIKNYKKK
jgi:hypothetical protein